MRFTSNAQLAVIGLLFCAKGALANAPPPAPDRNLSPYFVVQGGDSGVDGFPLKSTKVVASVNGVIADVVVTQVYVNGGATPINARYVFPASAHAAVHGLQVTIGERRVVAKIKERVQAAHEFEQAKREGKSAALLEEQRPNVFTMAVANILPKDVVEVELRYSELLVPSEGVYELVYPTVVGPRYANQPEASSPPTDRFVKNPYLHEGVEPTSRFDIKVSLSTAIPLVDLTCTSHAVDVSWEGQSLARVALGAKEDHSGNRDFILAYRLAGKSVQSGLLVYEGAKENVFLLMVEPPATVREAEIPPREYIFVLDVSGSMNGFPLDTAKEVIRKLVGGLRPTDKFNLVLFSGGSRVLAKASLPATRENIERAFAVIDHEQGGGGTELEAALRVAMELPRDEHVSRTVAVITDGFITAERGAFTLIRDNLNRTNLFAFGIGSSVNRYLIEGMARAGQGEPFVVTDPTEAEAAAKRFRDYVATPVLTDIKVAFNGFAAYDVEPTAQPDLFAERPIVLIGKWRGERAGEITVSGRAAAGLFSKTFRVADSVSRVENEALPQLWARRRIARLSDFNVEQDQDEAAREVTSIGLTYNLLTKYTSFIAVLEQVRNTAGQASDVDQPLPLPSGVSDLAVGGEYASGAEPELWLLAAAAGAVLLLVTRRRGAASL
jgi:Ca-activated chloride channel homolog